MELAVDFTKAELRQLYEVKLLTTKEIGDMKGCSAEIVRRKLHEFSIPANKVGPKRRFNPPKKELARLYQKYSMREIAGLYKVGETVVWKRLQEYRIKLRDFENGGHRLKPGRVFSKEHRKNLSKSHAGKWAGEKHPNWKGGAHQKHLRLRQSGEYRQWRIAALDRTDNKCQSCGIRQGSICRCCGAEKAHERAARKR